ncbi:MAG: YjbQ family protein, partial [Planctomycetes bacterium]|nr:YjbQ family protein [Planctomycetota bacterium]
MQTILEIETDSKEDLYDITESVAALVARANINSGMVNIYVRGATAGIMIQENWDHSVQNDVITLLKKLIPHGVWEHDNQDSNGDSH